MSEFLFRFREPLSAANSLICALLLLLWLDALAPVYKQRLANLPPIELTLAEPEVLPPAKPLPELPVAKVERTAPRLVAPAMAPVMAPTETGDTPVAPGVQSVQAAPLAPPALVAVAPNIAVPVAATPPVNAGREAEAAYAGKLRAYLQSIKRYPTGREASLQRPAGTATIWFSVRRSGDLADAGIEASSGAMLLDRTALATVRRGSYPAFPDDAWAGRAQQRFTVELDFVPK